MSDAGRAVCDQWVGRVLGVQLPGPAGAGAGAGVDFIKSRLAWEGTRKQIQADLQRLEAAVLSETAGEAFAGEVQTKVKAVYTVLDFLDARLIDKLDEMQNAEPGEARDSLRDEAREIIDEYTDYVTDDELTLAIDDNGFIDIDLVDRVVMTLHVIDTQLKSA